MLKVLATLSLITLIHNPLYDSDCCSANGDECKPVICGELKPHRGGDVYYKDIRAEKVRPSKDKDCHVCISGGRVWCVYVGAPEG